MAAARVTPVFIKETSSFPPPEPKTGSYLQEPAYCNFHNKEIKSESREREATGKRKLEMKKIENRQTLQVTFSKHKKGLFKKADQLSILTGAPVLVVAFSAAGRPFVFRDEGLMQRYFEGETNFSNAVEDEEYLSLGNIDLEQCSVDELELLVANLEEEEANILEFADELNATKLASGQQLTFPTLEAASAAVIEGVEATQLHNDLEIFLRDRRRRKYLVRDFVSIGIFL
ncbi:MADS-box protein AGL24-like [Aristolochia californica]|uniref:MADS-box protein AGL24-like n=1 Tax=Aristolochia californica TaxID=171875 RepID=UPI0035D58C76